MDLAMMLSDKRDDPPAPPDMPAEALETLAPDAPVKRARVDAAPMPPQNVQPRQRAQQQHPPDERAAPQKTSTAQPQPPMSSGAGPAPKEQPDQSPDTPDVIAAASSAARHDMQQPTPYTDLQRAVHNALENKEAALTTSDKVALALEVLRARQLELDLAQARNNIEALVTKTGSAPRTLRAVIPASTVKGLPVGTPVEIGRGKFLLSPTTNDPQALFLTLELQSFGPEREREGAGGPAADDATEDQDP